MALGSVSIVKQGAMGDLWYVIADVRPTSGANYTTGGETFAAAQVSRTGTMLGVEVVGGALDATNKSIVQWDPTNKKLVVYNQTANTDVGLIEAAANSNFSAADQSVRLLCFGK